MNLAIRSREPEQMDADDLPPEILAQVLADLGQVNSLTLARRPTIAFIKRALRGRRSFRLLDVGFGEGDMLRAIARWADRHDIDADLVGIDLNPRSARIARSATDPALGIDFRAGDYADLAGQGWDVVLSSMVAHHMTREQLIAFLHFMEAESMRGWLVNDLLRHRFAYRSFPLLARIMGWHRIIREDGQLSVARSYRPGEWPPILAKAGITDARVHRVFPFRLCVERLR